MDMTTYSLNCPNCGAPLTLAPNQSIAICVYCNSSVQILIKQDSPPVITKIPEISPEVVDEVKRLILIGFTTKAVEYYAEQSGLKQDESYTAINSIKKTIGYNPPLGPSGKIIITVLILISVVLITGGIYLAINTYTATGLVLLIIGLIFAYMNWYAFKSSLKAYFLFKNGIETNAKVVKRWDIKTYKATSSRPESLLIRMLLEVNKENQTTYTTEANCLLGEKSISKCQPGSIVKVKYNKNDPKKVVISGVD
jgi:hypothetical protein